MCALACIMVLEHSSGSMRLGADWLSWLGSATDSRLREDREAATTILVLCLRGEVSEMIVCACHRCIVFSEYGEVKYRRTLNGIQSSINE